MDEDLKIDVVDNEKLKTEGVAITQEEKDKFFRCFLADEPYIEAVELFGGKFKATFKSLTIYENEQVLQQIKLDQLAGIAEQTDQYFVTISTYRLGLALIEMNGLPFNEGVTDKSVVLLGDKNTTIVKLKAQVFKAWPTYKLTALVDAFRSFEQKIVKLTLGVTDPNFWNADK